MRRLNVMFAFVTSICGGVFSVHSIAATLPVRVIPEVKHDASLPLREMSFTSELTQYPTHRVAPLITVPLKIEPSLTPLEDEALQPTVGLPLNTIPGISFPGIGEGVYGFTVGVIPPDTNASVGLTQVVQWVNTSFIVFNKASGAVIQGPTLGKALWAGFGGPCETDNDGDPIVKYDRMANRWVMTQFAIQDNTHNTQCIAVSTTTDATGTYNRYAFDFGTNFNDYGKLGIWPDAYYMSFVMFPGGSPDDLIEAIPTGGGPSACAYDRTKMLAGNAATMQCFQPNPEAGLFLPADLDGATPPPAGTPNYYVGLFLNANGNTSPNNLAMWKFHVDWQNPANSNFTGPAALKVQPFNPVICNPSAGNLDGDCAIQPNTNKKLEVLADRLMYRLAYRNFGTHQSMVVNHNIQVGNQTPGTRWYEIRVNNQGTAVVYQQGTYSQNDDNGRWMGSIAMDKRGNMALGYSVSGPNVFPSIRYTGRIFMDALNTMRTEKTIATGLTSQVTVAGKRNRWGDYSSMAIDPSDDCTFWYTNEYIIQPTGAYNWNTWIASFKFPNCK